jgi:transcriptional regulator with XRE-family HTH domain
MALTNVMQASGPITGVTKTIASRLKQARADAGMSQGALATAAGLSTGAIGNIEAGARENPAGETIVLLARALGVRAEWLQSGALPKRDLLPSGLTPSTDHGAQAVSLMPHRVPPTAISWESLMDMRTEIPDSFIAAVPDDALQPGAPRGTSFIFSRDEPPAPGKAVLVRDRDGNTYLRRFRQGVGALWSAQATNDAYATLESERDGLTVLAVATWRSGGDV